MDGAFVLDVFIVYHGTTASFNVICVNVVYELDAGTGIRLVGRSVVRSVGKHRNILSEYCNASAMANMIYQPVIYCIIFMHLLITDWSAHFQAFKVC